MQSLGVNLEQTRKEILRELDPNFSPQADQFKNATSEKTNMSSKCELPQNPESPDAKTESIDTSKRYDVYCSERNQEVVVYSNALFKGIKRLFQSGQYDFMSQFIELEQADGQTIFVARSSVIKFCEHGVKPGAESVSNKKPE
jgi:hypothetical protein